VLSQAKGKKYREGVSCNRIQFRHEAAARSYAS